MGIVVSRYLDPASSEGALVCFIIDSLQLMHTLLTTESYFPELTPWNVIDFSSEGSVVFSLRELFAVDVMDMADEDENGEVEQQVEECRSESAQEMNAIGYLERIIAQVVVVPDDHDMLYTASPRIPISELPLLCV